jgi:tRNA/tmRNA/rRNA uracil-C5-methylase (TrmA/RlmC/RlmD family)
VDGLEEAGAWRPPERIVYVSCNPATLARDAGLLVHRAGYRCTAAGAVNMFPHTPTSRASPCSNAKETGPAGPV